MTESLQKLRMLNGSGQAEVAIMELTSQLGLMEEFGVDAELIRVRDGQMGVDGLLAGKGDACLRLGIGPALAAIEAGAPIRILAGANLRAVHAIFASNPTIRTVRDLERRRVGVGSLGALAHQLFTAIMLRAGVDPSTVEFVPIGNTNMVFSAIVAREVDAGLGEVDSFHTQDEHGVHMLPDGKMWEELPNFINQGSFTTVEMIQTRRKTLVGALAASARLYRHIHSPESWQTYRRARATAFPEEGPQEALSQWAFYAEQKPYAVNLLIEPEKLHYLQDVNVRMGLQTRILPFEDVADMSLAEEALALVGRAG